MNATKLEAEIMQTKYTYNVSNMKITNLVSTMNNVMDFYILEHCDNDRH
jgi:hypothetical protein